MTCHRSPEVGCQLTQKWSSVPWPELAPASRFGEHNLSKLYFSLLSKTHQASFRDSFGVFVLFCFVLFCFLFVCVFVFVFSPLKFSVPEPVSKAPALGKLENLSGRYVNFRVSPPTCSHTLRRAYPAGTPGAPTLPSNNPQHRKGFGFPKGRG